MSKKRVHEVAKELKSHGIELDNKEVVQELVTLGYDVKSHSSSLEEDQATSAVSAILAKRKPKAPEPQVAPKGFMVRRRAVMPSGQTTTLVQEQPPPSGEPLAPPPGPAVELAAEPEPAAEQPEAAEQAAPTEAAPEQVEQPAAFTPPAPQEAPEPTAPSMPQPQPEAAAPTSVVPPMPEAQPAAAAQAQPQAQVPQPRPPFQRPQAQGFRPGQPQGRPPMGGRPQPGVRPGGAARPQGPTAYVRPGSPAAHGRPAPLAGAQAQPGQPATPPVFRQTAFGQVQVIHNKDAARPTATQAVVISRPLVQVRRVTPASAAHRSIPAAPGRKAIGEVREFKVVPDHLGRGREFVDVTKNKTNKKRTANDKDTSGGFKSEVAAAIWGRVSLPIRGKKRKPTKKGQKTQITEMAGEKKIIRLQEGITVSELGQRMGVRNTELIKKLMGLGKMTTANQMVDAETAELIAGDYGWKVEKQSFEVAEFLPDVEVKAEDVVSRPPVVTVMGHVDHGKTSLLDAIRSADVASGEAGGITQHIGAYTVQTPQGDLTFLDTPGHEAFTAMRARGADVTDVVILVVAADDGVMPTTREAIEHARAAKVQIVVAINKMDLPAANLDKVKKELADLNLIPEDWGGDTIMIPVSAKKKEGIDKLLENVLLQAEVLELKANPVTPAVGSIIEAKLEKGRGPVATVLVREGTLRRGDAIVTGTHSGKVRMMINSRGEQVNEVKPGYSAEVQGLSGVPSAGDPLNVVADEKAAKEIADHRTSRARQGDIGKTSKETLDDLLKKLKSPDGKELKVVLKADVQGSLEAVAQAVAKLSTSKVKTTIIHKGVGSITESDVMMASASKGALVIGFNVKSESGAEPAAKAFEVELKTYNIIYELIDGVRSEMEGLLDPIRTEKKLGRAEVRNLFNVPKLGTIAGAAVVDGTIKRNAYIRLLRENKPVFTGKLASLRRFKDDVREVAQGYECGIGVENYADFKPGDIIEAYEIEETRPSLS
jgi:translation initiation factor IF-2